MQKHIQIFFILLNLQFYAMPISYIKFGIKNSKKIIITCENNVHSQKNIFSFFSKQKTGTTVFLGHNKNCIAHNILNVTLENYHNHINSYLTLFAELIVKHPELKEFITTAYRNLNIHMSEFENLITKNLKPSDNILKLVPDNKLQSFIDFIEHANYEIIEVDFIVNIFNSLKRRDTVILVCKNIHAIKIALYLIDKYRHIVSVEAKNLD